MSAPGQNKSGPRPSTAAAATVAQNIEAKPSETAEPTKRSDKVHIEAQNVNEEMRNKDDMGKTKDTRRKAEQKDNKYIMAMKDNLFVLKVLTMLQILASPCWNLL